MKILLDEKAHAVIFSEYSKQKQKFREESCKLKEKSGITKKMTKLYKLLRETLDKTTPPKGYGALRNRLLKNRPLRDIPTIKVSPENLQPISNT